MRAGVCARSRLAGAPALAPRPCVRATACACIHVHAAAPRRAPIQRVNALQHVHGQRAACRRAADELQDGWQACGAPLLPAAAAGASWASWGAAAGHARARMPAPPRAQAIRPRPARPSSLVLRLVLQVRHRTNANVAKLVSTCTTRGGAWREARTAAPLSTPRPHAGEQLNACILHSQLRALLLCLVGRSAPRIAHCAPPGLALALALLPLSASSSSAG